MRTQALAMMFWLEMALAGMYWPNIYDCIIHFGKLLPLLVKSKTFFFNFYLMNFFLYLYNKKLKLNLNSTQAKEKYIN
jgi:hypothetical protein